MAKAASGRWRLIWAWVYFNRSRRSRRRLSTYLVGLGDTSTGRICHLVAKFSFNLHFTPRVSVSAHKHDEKMQELLQRQAYQCLKVLCIVAGL